MLLAVMMTVLSLSATTLAEPTSEILKYPVLPTDPNTQVPYEDGTYYSKKINGCECNPSVDNNPCIPGVSCDCKYYAGSIQCMAFAKYCHTIYNKTKESDMDGIHGDGSLVSLNKSNLYSYLTKAGKKSYLRNSGHSIFVVTYTTTTVEFYDANYEGKCIVHHLNVSYDEFVKRFSTLDFAYTSSGKIVDF
ncbi:MAG: hypothetical protein NC203_04910 [Firmicutes bacterium]|nr:hypothetical protein [[Eubacterium] siraeum]MCM1487690.1 hypothetical protein [Bacillota bacterium]